MLNQVVIIGRLIADPIEDKIALAVPRSFKNEEGAYDTDFVEITIWGGIAENVKNYCHKGDLIGVKGRIEADNKKIINIVAEKITFLSSKAPEEKDGE